MMSLQSTTASPIVSALENNGFAILPNVFSGADIQKLSDALSGERLIRSRAGARHALSHTAIRDLAGDARLLAIANEVLGPDACPFRATLFDKNRTSNWLVVWHQDTALPLKNKQEKLGWGPWSIKGGIHYAHAPAEALSQILAIRVHLDDSTLENGALAVVPGSHRSGVLSDDEVHHRVVERSSMICDVPAGGVLAMRPLLIHSSSKSRADKPRRVVHIEYAATRFFAEGLELAIC